MANSEKQRILAVDTTLYGKGLTHAWRKASNGCDLIILSPYLTSGTAENVLAGAGPSRIYSLFDAETFANGSSSLATMSAILAAGHQIFCIPELHAKVVIAPERFASVGSQNLTRAGTRRREITAAFADVRTPRAIMEMIEPWIKEAWEVTPELVAAMEEEIKTLRPAFKTAQAKARAAQDRFEQLRQEIAARQRLAEKRRRHAGLSRLHAYAEHSRIPSEEVLGTVNWRYSKGQASAMLYSLMAKSRDTLTEWLVDGVPVSLAREHRYLCLLEDTGEIGWARLATTRISFISPFRDDYNAIDIDEHSFSLVFRGLRGDKLGAANLQIGICFQYFRRPHINVLAYFDSASLEIIDISPSDDPFESPEYNDNIIAWISANSQAFCAQTLHSMLSVYQPDEDRLDGALVRQFFGDTDTDIYLRVSRLDGENFFLARRGHYNAP